MLSPRHFLMAWGGLGILLSALAAQAAPTSPDYTDSIVAAGIPSPTHIAFAPDGSGRLFVTLKTGAIGVIAPGQPMRTFAKVSPIYSQVECGVLGLCFSPDFVEDHLLYVFVTVSATEQRILRYRDVNSVGAEGIVVVRGLPTRGVNHDGGSLAVGPDARLYWGIGDNGSKRGVDGDLSLLCAKIGRANLDGTIPADNPFLGAPAPRNGFIWATGFRNPFTMTFQPRTGRMWLGVVGSSGTGDTVPHSTVGYEQIFTPTAGEDGGWDDYEGNQPDGMRYSTPFAGPFAHPVIQYPTDYSGDASQSRALSAISRLSGTLTVTLQGSQAFRLGEIVQISGTQGFNGTYLVGALQSGGFTAASDGPDAMGSSNTGTVRALSGNGCVIGGCFYESTAFPAAARGAYFFADYNSGTIYQVSLDANSQPIGIQPFVVQAGGVTSLAMARDGSLYYADIASGSIHRVGLNHPTELLVFPTTFQVLEAGSGLFTVRLPSAPASDVTVQISVTGGTGVSIEKGSTLTFSPTNWNIPQPVKVSSEPDAATTDKTATLTVSASGYPDEAVTVNVTDTTATAPVLSAARVNLAEQRTGTIRVTLPSAPRKTVTLTAHRSAGSPSARVTSGGTMRFTPEDWNVPRTVQFTGPPARDSSAVFTIGGAGYFSRRVTVTMASPK